MQKESAIVLRNRIKGLPFVDVAAGLAQTLTTNDVVTTGDASNQTFTFPVERKPVSYDVIQVVDGVVQPYDNCIGKEVSLLPNSNRRSIIYFEDGTMVDGEPITGLQGYELPLRLVCWMNRLNLVGNAYQNIAGYCIAAIRQKISGPKNKDVGILQRLNVKFVGCPPQNADIFSKYTIKETDRQYLRPPYEFFAIDFRASFYVDPKCLDAIDFTQKVCN